MMKTALPSKYDFYPLSSAKRYIVVLCAVFLLSGCATTLKLKKPLPQGNRVAVVSTFSQHALFKKVGTTLFEDASYYHVIPGLDINRVITGQVAGDLAKNKHYVIVPIYAKGATRLASVEATQKHTLSLQYQRFVARIIRGKSINTIALITPGTVAISAGDNKTFSLPGYGLYHRSFIMLRTSMAFGAFQLYVVNAKNYKIIAKTSGSFSKEVSWKTWNRHFSKIPKGDVSGLRKVLRQQFEESLQKKLEKIGLI